MVSFQSLTTYTKDDVPLWIFVICCYGLYRYIICHFLLKKIALFLQSKLWSKSKDKKAKSDKMIMKFTHRTFDLIHYTSSALLGLFALHSRPYFRSVFFAGGCQEHFLQHPIYECTVIEKIYFMVFTAYYVIDFFYLFTNTSDIYTLFIHHVITLGMIFSSVFLCVPVLGLSIMLLHDVVDVPLYSGKIFSYLSFTRAKDVSLLVFAVMCTWFRMINYPIIVYYAIKNIPTVSFLKSLYVPTCGLLLGLYGCHIYWFIRILYAAISIFTGQGEKAIRDNRSD